MNGNHLSARPRRSINREHGAATGSILHYTGVHLLGLTEWILGDSLSTLFATGASGMP